MKLSIILEEQAGGDVKLGIVTTGADDATPREQAYAQHFADGFKLMIPMVVKALRGKEIILIPAPSSKN
jgi:hypothetical protein